MASDAEIVRCASPWPHTDDKGFSLKLDYTWWWNSDRALDHDFRLLGEFFRP
jgi:hypothetical protein